MGKRILQDGKGNPSIEVAVSAEGCQVTNDTSGVFEKVTIECTEARAAAQTNAITEAALREVCALSVTEKIDLLETDITGMLDDLPYYRTLTPEQEERIIDALAAAHQAISAVWVATGMGEAA